MKLKPTVAVPTAPTASSQSSDAPFPPPPRTHARTAFAAPPPSAPPIADSFEAFVRRVIARRNDTAATEPAPANVVNGTVVAETSIDGVRYLMLRCQPKPTEALLSLSPRERDIVNLIIKGYPNKMIADLLDISAWTVGTHLRRIFAKLGVTSRAAMVARYLHHLGD